VAGRFSLPCSGEFTSFTLSLEGPSSLLPGSCSGPGLLALSLAGSETQKYVAPDGTACISARCRTDIGRCALPRARGPLQRGWQLRRSIVLHCMLRCFPTRNALQAKSTQNQGNPQRYSGPTATRRHWEGTDKSHRLPTSGDGAETESWKFAEKPNRHTDVCCRQMLRLEA